MPPEVWNGDGSTTYNDHRGEPCLVMPWEEGVMPRLVPCVFYMVHPDVTPKGFNAHKCATRCTLV